MRPEDICKRGIHSLGRRTHVLPSGWDHGRRRAVYLPMGKEKRILSHSPISFRPSTPPHYLFCTWERPTTTPFPSCVVTSHWWRPGACHCHSCAYPGLCHHGETMAWRRPYYGLGQLCVCMTCGVPGLGWRHFSLLLCVLPSFSVYLDRDISQCHHSPLRQVGWDSSTHTCQMKKA